MLTSIQKPPFSPNAYEYIYRTLRVKFGHEGFGFNFFVYVGNCVVMWMIRNAQLIQIWIRHSNSSFEPLLRPGYEPKATGSQCQRVTNLQLGHGVRR